MPATQLRTPALGVAGATFTDDELLTRFVVHQNGRAFSELVRRHGPMVMGVCKRILQHDQDAEDAFQAAFLVLARKARGIRRQQSLAGWLYKVAYRIALKARAQRSKRKAEERKAGERRQIAIEDAHHDCGPLDEEIRRLPEKYRLPILLCYLQGRTNEEAAKLLRCPVGTLKVRMLRARQLLKSRLLRRGAGAALTALFAAFSHAQISNHLQQSVLKSASEYSHQLAHAWLRHLAAAKMKLAVALLLIVGLLLGTDQLLQRAWSAATISPPHFKQFESPSPDSHPNDERQPIFVRKLSRQLACRFSGDFPRRTCR